MRAFVVPPGAKSSDDLRRVERPSPRPGYGQVLIRVRAASLNYRDQWVVAGTYFGPPQTTEVIPLSDGAGEVVAVGDGVARVKVGDRVAGTFTQIDPKGPPAGATSALGSPYDGMLAEEIVLYEAGVVPVPAGYSFEEAACLPCAGVTAWNALMEAGKPIRPGSVVLVLGTGGVSTFALQFAAAAGARVVVTSSRDEKLARARAMGAAETINYKATPDWEQEVLRLTGGHGADCIVEVGGGGTLQRSYDALARGGKVCLIGAVAGFAGQANPFTLMMKAGHMHGIMVGDRAMFEAMVAAIETRGIRPVIDRVFPFEDAVAAYKHHASGSFMGKVVLGI